MGLSATSNYMSLEGDTLGKLSLLAGSAYFSKYFHISGNLDLPQPSPTEADEDAGTAGLPVMQTKHEDEHEEWIDWAAVEQQAGGGGGSSA